MSAMFPITGRRIPLMGLALIIGSVVGISLYTRPSQIGESAAGSQRWHEWMLDSLKYGGSSSCPSATVGPPQEYQWVAEMPTEYGGGYRQFQHTWNHCKSCPTRTIVSRMPC